MNKGLSLRRIVLNGQDIEYELQRKQVKNINLRIRQDGTVYVSASPTVSLTVIEKFMQSRSGLILSAIEGAKLAQRPLNDPAGDSITVLGRELPVTVIQGRKQAECEHFHQVRSIQKKKKNYVKNIWVSFL